MLWIDKKYVGLVSSRLNRFKQKSDTLWSFRCPLCGDSQKDAKKTRGFLYVNKDSIWFKCHNCSRSLSLGYFLKNIDVSLYNAYNLEKFEGKNSNTNFDKPKVSNFLKTESLLDIGAIPARKSIRAMDYLHSRRIPENRIDDLFYIRDFSQLSLLNRQYEGRLLSEERIIIPFISKSNEMFGLTGRSIGSGKRYVNIKLSEGKMFYGFQHINFKEPIYACEGAFDSMFLQNCIAVLNSGLHSMKNYILIFDNEPRNKDIIKNMRKALDTNKMLIWPSEWKYKDINEAIIDGVSQKDIQELVYKNVFEKLELRMKFERWIR